MAYDHNEVIWTPGRVHVGNEVETDVAAAFTALTNEVQAADLAPNAKLAPWNFVQNLSVAGPVFQATNLTVPAASVRLGGEYMTRSIRLRIRRVRAYIDPAPAPDISIVVSYTDDDGAVVGVTTFNVLAGFPTGDSGGLAVTVPRNSRLYVSAQTPGGTVVSKILVVFYSPRPWVA